MRTKILSIVALAVTAALVATAAALAGGSARNADVLSGAGATFPFPLISQWQKDYESKTGVQINYNPIGSGGGIGAITARTVDFGASDAPLTPDQLAACKGCVQIPWVLSATSVIYNLPGVPNNLKLTGPIIANIYLGNISQWDNAAIKKINPGVDLPQHEDHPRLALGRLGYDVQLHGLSVGRQPAGQVEDRQLDAGQLAGRRRRPRLVRSRGCRPDHRRDRLRRHRVCPREQDPVRTGTESGRQVRHAAGPARDRRCRAPGHQGAAQQRDAHRQPDEEGEGRPARLPDLHVLVRPPADELLESGGAAQVRLLRLDRRPEARPKLLFVPIPKPVLVASEKTLKRVQG